MYWVIYLPIYNFQISSGTSKLCNVLADLNGTSSNFRHFVENMYLTL